MPKNVRQRCNLSPTLLYLHIKDAVKELRYENIGGIKVNGIFEQMRRFCRQNYNVSR